MSDELHQSLLACPSPFCWAEKGSLFFDWIERQPLIHVRIACPCGVSGPRYQRDNLRTAARVAAEAWNELPRSERASQPRSDDMERA